MVDEAVKQFYDEFLSKRMVNYRIRGPNARLRAAIELVKPLVKSRTAIADIGCGIGIVSEAMAKQCQECHVYGIDISAANIEYARRTCSEPNLTFISASVTDQFEKLEQVAKKPFELITLIDVIEHVPEGDRTKLFSDLASISGQSCCLAITYPSPEFLDFLRINQPEEIQIIDNSIPLSVLIDEVEAGGWRVYSTKHVLGNQYIHAVFVREVSLDFRSVPPSLLRKITTKVDGYLFKPHRKIKYGVRPFKG